MSTTQLVVARFLDGRTVAGTTEDFSPDKASFDVLSPGSKVPVGVHVRELKAVFFVKSLMGDSDRHDVRMFLGSAQADAGVKVAVRFTDGEVTCGYTDHYDPKARGFMLHPANPNSNNKLTYVLAHAVDILALGARAELLLRESLDKTA